MAQLFTLAQSFGGAFKADALKIRFNGKPLGSLAQNFNLTFTQQVTLMYELGSALVYYVGGRAQGQAQAARVIGPKDASGDAPITGYGDICKPQNIVVQLDGGSCESGVSNTYTMVKAVLTSIGVSVASQDVVINQQLGYMFIDLQKS